jgi:hypothetical protein
VIDEAALEVGGFRLGGSSFRHGFVNQCVHGV